MQWKCKFCSFSSDKRAQLFKHYRLSHGTYSRIAPIPCLHSECLSTFKSFNALKVHLSRTHSQRDGESSTPAQAQISYQCHLFYFIEPCIEADYFLHLRKHLKANQKVQCPFQDCSFETNVYSTFNKHKSKMHQQRQ